MTLMKRFQSPDFFLLGIASSLIIVHLAILARIPGIADNLMVNAFFWCLVIHRLWEKRHQLNLESNLGSTICGLLLIIWMLIRSLLSHNYDDVLSFFSPLISALGLALLASGFKGLKQYGRELGMVLILAVPLAPILGYIDRSLAITTFDAKIATFLLWYLGFEVTRQGVEVILPTGAIEIYLGCSSLEAMISLGQLSFLVSVLFPLKVYQMITILVGGSFIAVIVNGVRLALMAFLVANGDQVGFQYWHGSQGGQIFSTVSFALFGILVYGLLEWVPAPHQSQPNSH